MNFLLKRVFENCNLKLTQEVQIFLGVCEPRAYENFPSDITSLEFTHLANSLLFSKEFYDQKVNGNRLYNKIVESLEQGY